MPDVNSPVAGGPALSASDGVMPDWLSHRAASVGSRLAAVVGTERWSFADLDRRVTRAARRLATLGVRPGDRVALLLTNGPDFVELVHAASRLGAVVVPVNVRLAAAEVAWHLADVGARVLVFDGLTADSAEAALDSVSARPGGVSGARNQPGTGQAGAVFARPELIPVHVMELSALREAEDVRLRQRIHLDSVHSILYTSGTTGRPKGAMLTYGNHWWNAVGSALNLGLHPEDRWLACLPLFHVGGLSILLRGVIYGIPVVVHPRFDPEAVNRAIDEEGITLVSVVSTMLARMLEARGPRPYPRSLRCVLVGGGPVPKPLLERCVELGVPVVQTYGLTEAASQVTTLAPEHARRKLGSAGRPLLPVEVQIEANGQPAAPGQPGEILVRGPTVSPGYFGKPGATAQAMRGGWLHTGDLGYFDEEGYLYVLDRRDDLIVSGGENIYPAEVEAVLLAHPAVEEAGVVGQPDPVWGQIPVAAVKPKDGCHVTEAELIRFCLARLARFKVPKRVFAVDALPRNAAGKLARRALQASLLEKP
ncbi:MAG: o-succinylbenzoate--CoA ligase [Bacillota bacterium]